jgi:hypothetical protein
VCVRFVGRGGGGHGGWCEERGQAENKHIHCKWAAGRDADAAGGMPDVMTLRHLRPLPGTATMTTHPLRSCTGLVSLYLRSINPLATSCLVVCSDPFPSAGPISDLRRNVYAPAPSHDLKEPLVAANEPFIYLRGMW